MPQIFLSYARADGKAAATRLRTELERVGFQIWRDLEDMQGGKVWKEQLREALRTVDSVVVLLTPAAVASPYVEWEWETALTLEKRVLPLLILPCDVPSELQRLHYHNLSTEQDYVLGFAALIRDLNQLGTANRENLSAPKPATSSGSAAARNVTIGGSANNNTIVTGDGNVVGSNNLVQRGKYNVNLESASGLNIGDTYYSNPSQHSSTSDRPESSSIRQKTILVLAANPIDSSRLALDQEVREIEEGLRRSKHRDLFKIEQRWAIRTQDLRRALLDLNPEIVHFCGHGTDGSSSAAAGVRHLSATPETDDEGGIVLEDETGKAKLVTGKALSDLFALFADRLECVVLNSCYSEVQASLIVQQVPIVIGMKRAIGDRAAIEFSKGFYDALGAGRPIEEAFKFGCNAIDLQSIPEHLTPVIKKAGKG